MVLGPLGRQKIGGKFSSRLKMLRITAFVIHFITNARNSRKHSMELRGQTSRLQPLDVSELKPLDVSELKTARHKILSVIQHLEFSDTMSCLQRNEKILQKDNLIKLDPFIHTDGLLRVGGRLKRANIEFELKHAILLPNNYEITKSLIRFHHQRTNGRGMTISEVRDNGLWIVSLDSLVRDLQESTRSHHSAEDK